MTGWLALATEITEWVLAVIGAGTILRWLNHGPLFPDRVTPLLDAARADHEQAERLLPEICGCSVRFSNEADRGEFTWCAAHCPDCRRERHGFLVPCVSHDAGWAEEMERRYAQS